MIFFDDPAAALVRKMLRFSLTCPLYVACILLMLPAAAAGQQVSQVSGCKTDLIESQSNVTEDGNHWVYTATSERPVRVDCDNVQLFATVIEIFRKEGQIIARGDVVFVQENSRISADRLEFDTNSKTGTFYNFSGTTIIREESTPQLTGTQEPNAFFWGEELHKVGPKKYKIVRGGFTACVQPTPRWDVASGNITLNLDDYALLRNSVFRVKGVPLMYLPIFYYPIQEDDRATGFLMPIYGTSTQKGQQLSNQFFWAIGRSHDATLVHDWFSKAGQGYGGEYRYVLAPGSSGEARFYMLNESEVTAEEADATRPARPGSRSYRIDGNLSQALPGNLRAQANANYFSSLLTEQRYQQDVFRATQRTRNFGGNITGNWAEYVVGARFEQNDYFDSQDTLTRAGSLPRITVSRGERPIGNSKIYFGANGEVVKLLRSASSEGVEIRNQGLTRLDVTPTVRIPFTKWPFFTINSSVSWRGTYWTRSLDLEGLPIDESIGRQYFDFTARATGPVFMRIFDTPNSGFATRWKHVIEPSFTVQRITAIDNFDRIIQLESPDYIVGNVTRYNYGIANRLYAKKDVSREVANVTVSQTYYTDQRAAQYDRNYESGSGGTGRPTNFSAVSVQARISPTDLIQGQFRTEWDPTVHTFRSFSANGTFSSTTWLESSAGWSMRRYLPDLEGFDDPLRASHSLDASVTLRTPSRRFGGTYNFNYDFRRDYFLQQRILAYYNAQCCGIAMEYQSWNLQGLAGILVPQDRRFNISFSLAGIGTFSNFFGALSGQSTQRR